MRRALATALVLSAVRTAGAEPCPPRAELGGDGAAVERVADELRRLGVTVASRPNAGVDTESPAVTRDGCAIVRAQVQLDASGGIAVAVRGATRGSEGRVVSDAALAAAWIDSWTRDDVDVALWAPPPRVAAAEPATALAPPHDAPVAPAPVVGSRWDRLSIAASYEQTWTDGTSWRGASASACVRVAGFCVGGRGRIAFDPQRLYNSTAVARDDYSVLATASYPVAVGTMSVAPEAGLGIGRLTTRRVEGACMMAPPPNCDPMDPSCTMPPAMCVPTDPGTNTQKLYVGDNFRATTYTPRISLALRVAVPLFDHVWLDGLAALMFLPGGHGGEFATEGPNNQSTLGLTSLPGEPSSGYLLGVGLRVGAR